MGGLGSIKGGGGKSPRGIDPSTIMESPESKAGALKLSLGFVSSKRGNSHGRVDYS